MRSFVGWMRPSPHRLVICASTSRRRVTYWSASAGAEGATPGESTSVRAEGAAVGPRSARSLVGLSGAQRWKRGQRRLDPRDVRLGRHQPVPRLGDHRARRLLGERRVGQLGRSLVPFLEGGREVLGVAGPLGGDVYRLGQIHLDQHPAWHCHGCGRLERGARLVQAEQPASLGDTVDKPGDARRYARGRSESLIRAEATTLGYHRLDAARSAPPRRRRSSRARRWARARSRSTRRRSASSTALRSRTASAGAAGAAARRAPRQALAG